MRIIDSIVRRTQFELIYIILYVFSQREVTEDKDWSENTSKEHILGNDSVQEKKRKTSQQILLMNSELSENSLEVRFYCSCQGEKLKRDPSI